VTDPLLAAILVNEREITSLRMRRRQNHG